MGPGSSPAPEDIWHIIRELASQVTGEADPSDGLGNGREEGRLAVWTTGRPLRTGQAVAAGDRFRVRDSNPTPTLRLTAGDFT